MVTSFEVVLPAWEVSGTWGAREARRTPVARARDGTSGMDSQQIEELDPSKVDQVSEIEEGLEEALDLGQTSELART
jgi:hypothetical protein